MKYFHGDCLDKLNELDDNSVDSIVTDPPYGLSFMGKKWDYDVPSQEIWEECLRVLKPGGHLLAFAGSRTYHRMAVRIEDAGFEIRDQIMWVYGSGFPKSLNIGKGVDKKLGNQREVVGHNPNHRERNNNMKEMLSLNNPITTKGNSEWEGWGTALKPAHEPIVMARKPFSGTVVDNVLKHGTGGINIDESRIGTDDTRSKASMTALGQNSGWNKHNNKEIIAGSSCGRFPANIIFDEEAGKILNEQSGISKTGDIKPHKENKSSIYGDDGFFKNTKVRITNFKGDSGGASRFFYCPKTSKKDRNEGLDLFEDRPSYMVENGSKTSGVSGERYERTTMQKNNHPTVKPTDLMLYLIRLVTRKGGTTLDPFMGSGSTGKAAIRGGFDFIGIEREKEYFEIAKARIDYEQKNPYDPLTKTRVQSKRNSNTTLDEFFE